MCSKCTEMCYAEALVMVGKTMSVEEVMEEVVKDKPFYKNSGGGVTFSGGEPMLQKEFLKALLEESKRQGLNTAVDTAGNVPWENFEDILQYTDLFLYDIKMIDAKKHISATGAENHKILSNLKKLAELHVDIWVRVPIIPGFNDNTEDMKKIALMLSGLKGVKLIELLPFHRLGQGKYESLGMENKAEGIKEPSEESMSVLREVFKRENLPVKDV